MDRKIKWYSGCHDEIELVYDKAEENASIAAILTELETMALREAEDLKWEISLLRMKCSLK